MAISVKNKNLSFKEFIRHFEYRFPNGDLLVIKLEESEVHESQIRRIREALHGYEKIDLLFQLLDSKSLMQEFGVNKIRPNYSKLSLFYYNNALKLVSDLAHNLYLGGCYFNTIKNSEESIKFRSNAKEILERSIQFVNELIPDYESMDYVYLQGRSWCDWFFDDIYSHSFFLFNKQSDEIIMLLIRDTD